MAAYTPLTDMKALYDFVSSDIESYNFDQLAYKLLSNFCLLVNNEKLYQLGEIEMYCCDKVHQDIYTHQHPDQLTFGNWYFHRFSSGKYKAGTFKGLDLTLGHAERYFGVLIRTLIGMETIEGPCKSVDTILSDLRVEKIDDFTGGKVLDVTNPYLRLVYMPHDIKLHHGMRIGLKPEKAPGYYQFKYRYSTLMLKKKQGLEAFKQASEWNE